MISRRSFMAGVLAFLGLAKPMKKPVRPHYFTSVSTDVFGRDHRFSGRVYRECRLWETFLRDMTLMPGRRRVSSSYRIFWEGDFQIVEYDIVDRKVIS